MKVSHPNPNLNQEEALKQLYDHPQFPKGARVVRIERVNGHWEAELEASKEASAKEASPPPFPLKDEETSDAPDTSDSSDSPSDDSSDSPDSSETDDSDSKPKEKEDKSDSDGKKSEKIDLGEVFDLIKQIAEHLDIPVGGEEGLGDLGEGLEGLDGGPEGLGDILDEGPPAPPHEHGIPGGPPAGPPPPKKPAPRPMKPGEAPPGATPVGAPAFASTAPHALVDLGIATFDVKQRTAVTLKQAEQEIHDIYGPHGYKVKQIIEGKSDANGEREVSARISKR